MKRVPAPKGHPRPGVARRLPRVLAITAMAGLHLLALACAPALGDTYPEVASQPLAWQCPTPSPIPTRRIGWDEEYGGGPPPTPTTYSREPIYSTPVPTATPYIRTGGDYYAGQRLRVGPVIVSASPRGQTVEVTVEHDEPQPVELHLVRSVVRQLRRADGRMVEGSWNPDTDPREGVWPAGRHTVDLSFGELPGEIASWGMSFTNTGERRTGETGGKWAWWLAEQDPHCGGKAGGPPSDAYDAPALAGQPGFGRGGWPTTPDLPLSRGYGCHSFYTGVRGPSCPPGAPWWHNGLDIAGSGPTYAVRAGEVLYAGPDSGSMDCSGMRGSQAPHTGYGLYHRLRDVEGYVLIYGHEAQLIVRGGEVAGGQQIGVIGSTGCSTGNHLHFTVYGPDGRERNPFDILKKE